MQGKSIVRVEIELKIRIDHDNHESQREREKSSVRYFQPQRSLLATPSAHQERIRVGVPRILIPSPLSELRQVISTLLSLATSLILDSLCQIDVLLLLRTNLLLC